MCRETPAVRPPAVSSWGHGCRDAPFDLPARLSGRLQPGGEGRRRARRRRRRLARQPADRGLHLRQGAPLPRAHVRARAHPASRRARRAERERARSATSAGTRRSAGRRGARRRARSVRRRVDPAVLLRRLERLPDPGRARRAPVSAAGLVAPPAHRLRGADRRRGRRSLRQDARRRAAGLRARAADRDLGLQPDRVGHPPRSAHPAGAAARRPPGGRRSAPHAARAPGRPAHRAAPGHGPARRAVADLLAVRERARRSRTFSPRTRAAPTRCGPAPRPGRSRAPRPRRASPPPIWRRSRGCTPTPAPR